MSRRYDVDDATDDDDDDNDAVDCDNDDRVDDDDDDHNDDDDDAVVDATDIRVDRLLCCSQLLQSLSSYIIHYPYSIHHNRKCSYL